MKVINCKQGTPEWYEARTGRVTASRIKDVIARLKRGDEEAANRKNYRVELVCEILTGNMADHYTSPAMEWGIANETFARASYEIANNCMVEQIGFVIHPTLDRAGASPDGLVGEDGLLEIKCPNTATHIDYILADKVPAEYEPQIMWQLACTGRKWCDFVSYDPRLPEYLQLFTRRMTRDDARIAEIEKEVQQFLIEVDSLILSLPCGDGRSAIERQLEAELVKAQSQKEEATAR